MSVENVINFFASLTQTVRFNYVIISARRLEKGAFSFFANNKQSNEK